MRIDVDDDILTYMFPVYGVYVPDLYRSGQVKPWWVSLTGHPQERGVGKSRDSEALPDRLHTV